MNDLLDPNSEVMNPISSLVDHETMLFYPGVPDSWYHISSLLDSGGNLSVDDYLADHIILQPSQPARVHVSAHVLPQAEMTSRSKRKVDDESLHQVIELRGRESGRKQSNLHNFCEKRRRGRINENIKALGELIPACTKTDKASILDEAVVYIRALQLQAETTQSMSRSALYMSQSGFEQVPYYSPYLSTSPRLMGIGDDAGFQMTCPMFSLPSADYHPSIGRPTTAVFPQDSGLVAPPHYQSSIPMVPFNYAYEQFEDTSSSNMQRNTSSS